MWQKLTVKLNGVSPLIQHNGRLADPTHPVVKAMKKISSKRKKTDADFEELARLEFQGGLYMGDDGPVLPAHVIEATFINGAKKTRDGMTAKAGMFVEENACLEYEGPKDREELWEDESYRHVAKVSVGRASIMRTRPIFDKWAATVTVNYDDEQADERQVTRWIEDAGRLVGFCDWRPRYGRFEVVSVVNGKED